MGVAASRRCLRARLHSADLALYDAQTLWRDPTPPIPTNTRRLATASGDMAWRPTFVAGSSPLMEPMRASRHRTVVVGSGINARYCSFVNLDSPRCGPAEGVRS